MCTDLSDFSLKHSLLSYNLKLVVEKKIRLPPDMHNNKYLFLEMSVL